MCDDEVIFNFDNSDIPVVQSPTSAPPPSPEGVRRHEMAPAPLNSMIMPPFPNHAPNPSRHHLQLDQLAERLNSLCEEFSEMETMDCCEQIVRSGAEVSSLKMSSLKRRTSEKLLPYPIISRGEGDKAGCRGKSGRSPPFLIHSAPR